MCGQQNGPLLRPPSQYFELGAILHFLQLNDSTKYIPPARVTFLISKGKRFVMQLATGIRVSIIYTHWTLLCCCSELVEGLEHKGHHLYCNNYYSSRVLFSDLRELGFGACGTVRFNCRGLPEKITSKSTISKGN